MKGAFFILMGMLGTAAAAAGGANQSVAEATPSLLREAQTVLSQALISEEGWPKIHAAEALVAVGLGATARA